MIDLEKVRDEAFQHVENMIERAKRQIDEAIAVAKVEQEVMGQNAGTLLALQRDATLAVIDDVTVEAFGGAASKVLVQFDLVSRQGGYIGRPGGPRGDRHTVGMTAEAIDPGKYRVVAFLLPLKKESK